MAAYNSAEMARLEYCCENGCCYTMPPAVPARPPFPPCSGAAGASGVVTPAAAVADLSLEATLTQVIERFNELLGNLRTAGLLSG